MRSNKENKKTEEKLIKNKIKDKLSKQNFSHDMRKVFEPSYELQQRAAEEKI